MSLEDEKRSIYERKRNILYLISRYLIDFGLTNTNSALLKESNIFALQDYQLCDNIDLETIYLEYLSYQHVKFAKYPKITKKLNNLILSDDVNSIKKSINRRKSAFQQQKSVNCSSSSSSINTTNTTPQIVKDDIRGNELASLNSSITVSQLITNSTELTRNGEIINVEGGGGGGGGGGVSGGGVSGREFYSTHIILPPLRDFEYYTPEWKEMAETISRDIIKCPNSKITWSSVKGHQLVQDILNESVIVPLRYPDLFSTNNLIPRPWKCVLLHGPPGTGKTLIARALNSETHGKITFFNCVSSTLISKWRGDSEKFIRCLFELAKFYAPSIIFIDEIDGLTSKRDAPGDHESTRRFKNEFLQQIDSLEERTNIFLLASTNLPWEIDVAFLRRFERKLLLGLPNGEDRIEIMRQYFGNNITGGWSKETIQMLEHLSDGFSGDDCRIACKEASMTKIRTAIQLAGKSGSSPTNHLKDVNIDDLKLAISHVKPSTNPTLLTKHIEWNGKFGNQ